MGFAEHMAMAVLLRWQESNNNVEIWYEDKKTLLPFAQELYDDFLRQIKIEMEDRNEAEA